MAATITPNHAAQMRETFLSVTAGHRIAFKDTNGFHQDLLDEAVAAERAREYPSLMEASRIKREALGATEALLAKVFDRREAA